MTPNEPLSARNLAHYGLRRGAYDGGNGRRFVCFEKGTSNGEAVEWRAEFGTKTDRDNYITTRLAEKQAQK